MEGWGKIGVQPASVLYPNSCYKEPCYIKAQVYICQDHKHLSNFSASYNFFIMLGDVTTYDLRQT